MSANDRKMDDTVFGGADHNAQSKVASSSNQKASSWKHIGYTRLEFTSSVLTTSLDCSVSRGSLFSTITVPKRLLSQRIVPWRHAQTNKECFLLKSNTNNQNLDIKTMNAMLLSVKSAMLFQDAQHSCRTFAYVPRSLYTASLMEYNNTHNTTSTALQERIMKKTTPKKVSTVSNPEKEMTNTSLTASVNDEMEPTVPIEAVEPDKLETLYQSCLDTNEPTPRIFSQIVAKSLVDMDMVGNWLVSSFQIQNKSTDNPRLLPLQTCLRLALAPNAKFLKLHYKVTCKSAVSKKSRKKLKKMSPQEVLQDQVFNLLSLLAIRCCDPPVDFECLVKELCIGVSQDVVKVIFDYFEFHEKEEEQEPPTKMERFVPAVTPATTTTKTTVKDPILPRNEPLLAIQQENMAHSETNDAMSIIKQEVSLTQCRSTRKNSLVPNQKRKYVGSHFASGLSNVSTLFRQVKVPKATATAVAPKRMKPTTAIQLEPRRRCRAGDGPPLKRPRTTAFERRAKQVITETPAKKLVFYPPPHSSFSPMRSDHSQNARLLAQQALAAAARRKL